MIFEAAAAAFSMIRACVGAREKDVAATELLNNKNLSKDFSCDGEWKKMHLKSWMM